MDIIEENTYTAWGRNITGTYKKVLVNTLRLGDDGKLAVNAASKLMPGAIASPADREAIVTRLVAAKAQKDAAAKARQLAAEHHLQMMVMLEAAGFAWATYTYNGIIFGKAAIAAWAEDNVKE
jgi:hypothetical protein